MIRVRVDLVPFGNEDRAKQIGQLVLANDGWGNALTGNYVFVYTDDNGDSWEGSVKDFPRNNGVWQLISECVNSKLEPHDEDLVDKLWERLDHGAQ